MGERDAERTSIRRRSSTSTQIARRARSTYWSTLYNPRAEQHDLALAAKLPGGQAAESAETLLSWNGLAGSGLGGMHASGTALDITRVGYRIAPQLNALEGVPILSASTKSFLARWTAAASAPASAELKLDDNGLLLGTVKECFDRAAG